MLAGIESAFPRDVHEVVRAGAAQAGDARLGECLHQAVAEQRDLLGKRHFGERQIVGMNMHVPQAGQQVRAFEIDDRRVAGRGLAPAGQDFGDAALLDDDGGVGRRFRLDAVDQCRVGVYGSVSALVVP